MALQSHAGLQRPSGASRSLGSDIWIVALFLQPRTRRRRAGAPRDGLPSGGLGCRTCSPALRLWLLRTLLFPPTAFACLLRGCNLGQRSSAARRQPPLRRQSRSRLSGSAFFSAVCVSALAGPAPAPACAVAACAGAGGSSLCASSSCFPFSCPSCPATWVWSCARFPALAALGCLQCWPACLPSGWLGGVVSCRRRGPVSCSAATKVAAAAAADGSAG